MHALTGLRPEPHAVSHLACIKGCLNYLGVPISTPWLYGGTGHAFVINIHEDACPSGPTAWNTSMLFQLAPNLGYRVEGISRWQQAAGDEFAAEQRRAYDFVRANIDAGRPCYGWQLQVPDYYIIDGYDDTGYYFRAPWAPEASGGPLPWDKLGAWDVTLLEVFSVTPGEPALPAQVVKDAVAAAAHHAAGGSDWINPGYRSGPAAFDVWAAGIEKGIANRDGHAYNAAVWSECRAMAVDFLAEAQTQLPDTAFGEAIDAYTTVRDALAACAPYTRSAPTPIFNRAFPQPIRPPSRRPRCCAAPPNLSAPPSTACKTPRPPCRTEPHPPTPSPNGRGGGKGANTPPSFPGKRAGHAIGPGGLAPTPPKTPPSFLGKGAGHAAVAGGLGSVYANNAAASAMRSGTSTPKGQRAVQSPHSMQSAGPAARPAYHRRSSSVTPPFAQPAIINTSPI